ncbi:hypothetical protein BMG05_07110 [Mycobacterium malmoense]|nr:hypothetical protein BMG05_07110 [Mycobacterium malmoense]
MWCRLDRRLERLAGWQAHRATANGCGFDLGQIPGEAFEVFAQVAACLGDIRQSATNTRDLPKLTGRSLSTPCRASSLRCFGATCGRPGTVGHSACFPRSGNKQRCDVEKVFPEPQSRPSCTPIIQVQQRFEHL